MTVFDLDNPNVFASLHGSLSECVYVKNPISAPRVKRTYLDAKSKKTKTYTSEWHGLTDDKSGSKPRGRIKLVGGAEGLLTYSNCELDRKGKDGGMACAAPGKKIPM